MNKSKSNKKSEDSPKNKNNKIIQLMDQNGDGKLTIEDVIIASLKVPGIKIDRDSFLRKEFNAYFDEATIDKIIEHNPAYANISRTKIDNMADAVIQFERVCVSGISTALSAPGGIAMVATIPADITQYYGYMLRATQKLLYLYGFPEIDMEEAQIEDSATMNTIILCMGVMYGVTGANKALKAMASALGKGVEKKLLNTALTKGTIYPIVKKVAKWFSIHMTKDIFAGFFKKAIPVVGGIIGGGITYATFKPCCIRLRDTLKETKLANPNVAEENFEELEVAEDLPDTHKEEFYVVKDEEAEGPYEIKMLKEMIDKKEIEKSTLIWKKGMPEWIPAKSIEELKNEFMPEIPHNNKK